MSPWDCILDASGAGPASPQYSAQRWRVVERRIAFEKRYEGGGIIKRKQFAKAPNTAQVARIARARSNRPEFAEARLFARRGKLQEDLKRTAATLANINPLPETRGGAAIRKNAALQSAASVDLSAEFVVVSIMSGNIDRGFMGEFCPEAEFTVGSHERCLHIFLGHNKRNIGFRRALGDGDDVHVSRGPGR